MNRCGLHVVPPFRLRGAPKRRFGATAAGGSNRLKPGLHAGFVVEGLAGIASSV